MYGSYCNYRRRAVTGGEEGEGGLVIPLQCSNYSKEVQLMSSLVDFHPRVSKVRLGEVRGVWIILQLSEESSNRRLGGGGRQGLSAFICCLVAA